MGFVANFQKKHSGMFEYMIADEVHPHDRFLARIIVRYLPLSITPNQISIFRIFLTPVVFLLILYGYLRIGVFLFLFAALTDAVDGSMARTQNKITKFGMLIDPLADKLLIGSMVLLLVFQHFHPFFGITILAIEIIFIIAGVLAKVKFKKTVHANRWGKIKMVLQVVAVFFTIMALLLNFPYMLTIASWGFGLSIGFAFLSLFKGGI